MVVRRTFETKSSSIQPLSTLDFANQVFTSHVRSNIEKLINHLVSEQKMEEKLEQAVALEQVEHGHTIQPFTEEEKRKVVRKLDLHLLPFCFALYTFSVLDVSIHNPSKRGCDMYHIGLVLISTY